MALNYDFSEVKNHKSFTQYEMDMLDRLIFMTMVIGINKVTSENKDEVYMRVHLVDLVCENGIKFKPQDVARNVGLKTNASLMTWNQFTKKLTNTYRSEALNW